MITADLIKALREKTGAGMMDCKKALVETNSNFDEAVDWLRKKGLAAAAKKASRVAADGLIGVMSDNQSATMVEVNSETDFVARNEKFQDFVQKVTLAAVTHQCHDIETLNTLSIGQETVASSLSNLIAVIGENITLRRIITMKVSNGIIATYIHSMAAPNVGKIGVLVGLNSDGNADKLAEFGKKLAMHIAASNPQYLRISDIPSSVIEHEKTILLEQIKDSNRPQNVIEKMIEGRIRKFYEEVVLEEQVYVMDGKKKVSEVLNDFTKEIGHEVKIQEFSKFVLGEGIEKEESDFLAEVESMNK